MLVFTFPGTLAVQPEPVPPRVIKPVSENALVRGPASSMAVPFSLWTYGIQVKPSVVLASFALTRNVTVLPSATLSIGIGQDTVIPVLPVFVKLTVPAI